MPIRGERADVVQFMPLVEKEQRVEEHHDVQRFRGVYGVQFETAFELFLWREEKEGRPLAEDHAFYIKQVFDVALAVCSAKRSFGKHELWAAFKRRVMHDAVRKKPGYEQVWERVVDGVDTFERVARLSNEQWSILEAYWFDDFLGDTLKDGDVSFDKGSLPVDDGGMLSNVRELRPEEEKSVLDYFDQYFDAAWKAATTGTRELDKKHVQAFLKAYVRIFVSEDKCNEITSQRTRLRHILLKYIAASEQLRIDEEKFTIRLAAGDICAQMLKSLPEKDA